MESLRACLRFNKSSNKHGAYACLLNDQLLNSTRLTLYEVRTSRQVRNVKLVYVAVYTYALASSIVQGYILSSVQVNDTSSWVRVDREQLALRYIRSIQAIHRDLVEAVDGEGQRVVEWEWVRVDRVLRVQQQ